MVTGTPTGPGSPSDWGSRRLSSPLRHGVLTHRRVSLSDRSLGDPSSPLHPGLLGVHPSPGPWPARLAEGLLGTASWKGGFL